MKRERPSNYPQTMSEYLQAVIGFIIREGPDEIGIEDMYKLFRSAVAHCPIDREVLKKAEPYNLLVICDQNQGRSQIEEAIIRPLAEIIGISLNIASAGVSATPDKYGGRPGPIIIQKMEELGIPMDGASVDQLTENDIDENTILLALCAKEKIPDYAFKAKVVIAAEIDDDFPGSEVPVNETSLDPIIEKTAWLALRVVAKLAETIEQSDFAIFEKEFERLILTQPVGVTA